MNGAQFKLSNKFIVSTLFVLVAFGIYASLDLGVKVWSFNSSMEQSLPLGEMSEELSKDIDYLNARIQLLETMIESKSIYQTLTEKIEHRIWVFHALFQFIFWLIIYKYLIFKPRNIK